MAELWASLWEESEESPTQEKARREETASALKALFEAATKKAPLTMAAVINSGAYSLFRSLHDGVPMLTFGDVTVGDRAVKTWKSFMEEAGQGWSSAAEESAQYGELRVVMRGGSAVVERGV